MNLAVKSAKEARPNEPVFAIGHSHGAGQETAADGYSFRKYARALPAVQRLVAETA